MNIRVDQAEPYARTEAITESAINDYFDAVVVITAKRLPGGWSVHAHTRGVTPEHVTETLVMALRDTAQRIERGEHEAEPS